MKTIFIPSLALAGMLAFAPGAAAGLAAQAAAAPAAPAGSIVGFSSIPWGSSEAAVVARAGRPTQTTPMHDLKVLVYTEQLLGENVTTVYYLHPQHGLIAGGYFVPYTYGNSCWEIYGKFKSAIAERYPDLRPEVQENNQSQSLDMCAAIGIHRADAATTWNDSANGARAYVQINNDPREVQTMYFSAHGLQDIEAANASERHDHF